MTMKSSPITNRHDYNYCVTCWLADLPAGEWVDGNDVWLLGSSDGLLLNEIVEVSSFVNDLIIFDHCHSGVDIDASQSEPADIYLQLFHENAGAQLRVVGRQCNPT